MKDDMSDSKKIPEGENKPKKTRAKPPKNMGVPLVDLDLAEFPEYLKTIINDISEKQIKLVREQQERIDIEERVYHLLSEYLSGFILIGYNAYNNERIILKAAKNEQQDDSLYELLKISFIQIMKDRIQETTEGFGGFEDFG
jgi:hypothetical protein